MSEEGIKCECGLFIEEKQFKNHFKACPKLIDKYKDLDFKIGGLIKTYLNSKESLIIAKFIFKRFIKLFEYKLKDPLINTDKIENETKDPSIESIENIIQENNIDNNNNKNENRLIRICFRYGLTFFNEEGRMDEKLSDIMERYRNGTCPSMLLNDIVYPTYKSQKLDPDKTLEELQYKEGEYIILNHLSYINQPQLKEEKYNLEKYIPRNSNVEVKEHQHGLVYCITIFPWSCNLCKINYDISNAKYYCSLCDFNMCDNCHSKGNYTKKKSFPENNSFLQIPFRQFYKTIYHEHSLIYCRSSRSNNSLIGWVCDICERKFKNEDWSFFCTKCNFDVCINCIKKAINLI